MLYLCTQVHQVPPAPPDVPPQHQQPREHEAQKEVQGTPVQNQPLLQKPCPLHGQTAEQDTQSLKYLVYFSFQSLKYLIYFSLFIVIDG